MYKCGWNGCEKAYGTLNHLNAHVTMQSHGQKRTPEGESRPPFIPGPFLVGKMDASFGLLVSGLRDTNPIARAVAMRHARGSGRIWLPRDVPAGPDAGVDAIAV